VRTQVVVTCWLWSSHMAMRGSAAVQQIRTMAAAGPCSSRPLPLW
jgi:hypothetical protein